jgi:uncharacterized Zn finger protein
MVTVIFKCEQCGHDECKIASDYGFNVTAECIECGYKEDMDEDEGARP